MRLKIEMRIALDAMGGDRGLDVVVEGASQGFSIVSDDLNFDGVDDLVCGLPGFMDFPADNEERGFRPHGAVQLFSGGRG